VGFTLCRPPSITNEGRPRRDGHTGFQRFKFKDATNIYYDINEGPLVRFDRLKRVWTAATTNFTISKFDFTDDMKILVNGNDAVQVGTWMQTQENRSGQSREIKGRASVLWRKRDGTWKVWHYHASITPARGGQRPPQ
jgi:hypothetical protein